MGFYIFMARVIFNLNLNAPDGVLSFIGLLGYIDSLNPTGLIIFLDALDDFGFLSLFDSLH